MKKDHHSIVFETKATLIVFSIRLVISTDTNIAHYYTKCKPFVLQNESGWCNHVRGQLARIQQILIVVVGPFTALKAETTYLRGLLGYSLAITN